VQSDDPFSALSDELLVEHRGGAGHCFGQRLLAAVDVWGGVPPIAVEVFVKGVLIIERRHVRFVIVGWEVRMII
jgi:hypothetical protein